MFYSHEILKKRGKFGIIWLAATSRQKITRRDILSVNVVRASEDVLDILTKYVMDQGKRKARLSLYLSSQLMFGLAYVNSQQCAILLDEAKNLICRLGSFKVQGISSIELELPVSDFKVTFDPPNMIDVPLDFGRLEPLPEPSEYCSYEFFLITTPRSSEEWVVTPGSPDQERRAVESLPESVDQLHTVDPADITITDAPAFESEEPIPFELAEDLPDFLTQPDLFPLDVVPEQMPSQQVPLPAPIGDDDLAIPGPSGIGRRTETTEPDLSFLLTPDVITTEDVPLQATRASESTVPHADHRRRPSDERSESFVLGPVTRDGRRRRRPRRLIIDAAVVLPPTQMRNNIAMANSQLTIPLTRPSLLESAESLLTRFSQRIVPPYFRNLLGRSRVTLPEPNDPLPFVFGDREETSQETIEERNIPTEQDLPMENEPVEMQRNGDIRESTFDPSAIGLFTSSSRGPDLSSGIFHTVRDSTPLPSMHQDDLLEPLADVEAPMDKAEPEILGELEQPLPHVPKPSIKPPSGKESGVGTIPLHVESIEGSRSEVEETMPYVCKWSPVSPERIPPPPSPVRMTPVLEETLELVRAAMQGCRIEGLTTFSAVLRLVAQNKRRVAQIFYHLLCLHALGIIHLDQPSGQDVFIKLVDEEGRYISVEAI